MTKRRKKKKRKGNAVEQPDRHLGDLTLKDDGRLGLSIYKDKARVVWLNFHSEKVLLKFLLDKHGTLEEEKKI